MNVSKELDEFNQSGLCTVFDACTFFIKQMIYVLWETLTFKRPLLLKHILRDYFVEVSL